MKRFTEVEVTSEMQLWIDDAAPPATQPEVYTELGPFIPKRRNPIGQVYAVRRDYAARHFPKPRKGQLRLWVQSTLREAGDFLVGAFQPIREAM